MLEKLPLISVNGGYDDRKMLLIGSERCEFFHAAKELLNELNLGYNYSILDKLELEEMQAVVAYLKENYTKDIVCPFLLYEENKYLSGFDREIWIESIT